MPKDSVFLVCGPSTEDDNASYWSNHAGWTEDITEATVFDSRVLTAPLPDGGTGIVEYVNDTPVKFFGKLPLPPREVTINLKL